ncbi:MAG TPA: hypothetical protein VML75_07840 [Kofleriaceae bacterium]|nr:hypothetical protein [Kofleriaceae bacterium]
MKAKTLLLGTTLLAFTACGMESDETDVGSGVLEVNLGDDSLSGSFSQGDAVLQYEAETIAPGVFVSRVQLNGMVLVATQDKNDPDGVVINRDGYAEDGTDTIMTEADRLVIAAFVGALEEALPEIGGMDGAPGSFSEIINKWSQWPSVMSLVQHEVYETQRSGNQCYYAKCSNGSYTGNCADRYVAGSHDCNVAGWWTDKTTLSYIQMGDHCGTSDEDSRVATAGGSTVCGASWRDNDHNTDREYAVGNCFGRYGGGCGSGRSYNWESLDHDTCVRNGHWITSSYCSDELYYTHSDGNCY